MDSRFVYGLLVLLLFALANLCGQWGARKESHGLLPTDRGADQDSAGDHGRLRHRDLYYAYGWNGYGVFWANATSAANPYFPDYQSLRFRSPQDYVLMLLTMAAFLALGMRRSRDLFQIESAGAMHGGCLPRSAGCMAAGVGSGGRDRRTRLRKKRRVASGELRASSRERHFCSQPESASCCCWLFSRATAARDAVLAKIARLIRWLRPITYVPTICRTPLFNSFSWGGFLTWYLPQYPVAIDGRTDLYGPDFNIQYAKTS